MPSRSFCNRFTNRIAVAAAVASLIGMTLAVQAQPVAAEAVEELRLLLKAPVSEPSLRDRAVTEQCKLLDGINDFRRALILREWRDEDPDGRVAVVDLRNRTELARRFE